MQAENQMQKSFKNIGINSNLIKSLYQILMLLKDL